jgi:hypothetical protein
MSGTELIVTTQELDRVAAQIEAGGTERDGRVASFIKGMSASMFGLLAAVGLVKGDDASGEDKEKDEDTEEDRPGFDDANMTKGGDVVDAEVVATPATATPEAGHIEAGDLVKGLASLDDRLTALQDENALLKGIVSAQDGKLVALQAASDGQSQILRDLAKHTAEANGALVKGLSEIYDVTRSVVGHAPAITPDPRSGVQPRLVKAGDAPAFNGQALVKGKMSGLLKDADVAYYQKHGVFDPDPAKAKTIADQMTALTASST